jgi:hypothetical protein
MRKKCKHCCWLHGFELKSFSFPLRTWEHDDSMSSNDNETFLRDTKMTAYGISIHIHTHVAQ